MRKRVIFVFSITANDSGLSLAQQNCQTSLRSKRAGGSDAGTATSTPPLRSKRVSSPLASMIATRLVSQLMCIVAGRQRSWKVPSGPRWGSEYRTSAPESRATSRQAGAAATATIGSAVRPRVPAIASASTPCVALGASSMWKARSRPSFRRSDEAPPPSSTEVRRDISVRYCQT